MSRPLRIQYPNAWYHVMNRGRRGEEIFKAKDDYKRFIENSGDTILREFGGHQRIRGTPYSNNGKISANLPGKTTGYWPGWPSLVRAGAWGLGMVGFGDVYVFMLFARVVLVTF